MRRNFFLHLLSLIIFSLIFVLIKHAVNINALYFVLGAILGTILPDTDHLIYVYFLAPQDLISQRIRYSFTNHEVLKGIQLAYESRYERTKVIFHTAFFQIIFLALTIFVFTSTSGVFGKGLVIGFSAHLLIDELTDLTETGSFASWFSGWENLFSWEWDKRKLWSYLGIILVLLLGLIILY